MSSNVCIKMETLHRLLRNKRVIITTLTILLVIYFGSSILIAFIAGIISLVLGASYKLYNKSINESKEEVEKRKVKLLRKLLYEAATAKSQTSERSNDGNETDRSFFQQSKEDRNGSSSPESFTVPSSSNHSSPNNPYFKPTRNKMDMRLTGSAIIDETLHEMIDFIMRDYVHSWYDFISEDDEFIHELRKTIQETLVNLSSRVKEIDWIPFLTTQLVDDAASHLRLYRTALAKTKENPNSDLVAVFFDIEAAMEKNLCRDMVCTDDLHLQDYLQGITEGLLYLLLPQETYSCTPVGALAQDLLVNYVFVPILQLFSDPDFVNQYIIWLCQSFPVTPEILVTVIRMCDTIEEITAVLDFFNEQISETEIALKHKASPDEQATMRAQLKGLSIIKRLIEQRLSHLKEGKQMDWTDDGDGDQWQNYFMTPGLKLHSLSLDEVLKNSIALAYFIDFMNSVNGSHYILMYLNADAWKASAEQQLGAIETTSKNSKLTPEQSENNQTITACMRDAATNIYDQFLSEKAVPRVKLPENAVKRFYIQVRTEPTISTNLFDEIQESLVEVMRTTEKFYPSFLRHKLYVKCLMELDVLKAESVTTNEEDDDDVEEDDVSVEEFVDVAESIGQSITSSSSLINTNNSDEDYQLCRDCLKQKKLKVYTPADELAWDKNMWSKKYKLNAEIIEAGLHGSRKYGVYAVQVTRLDENDKKEKKWHIYRRYSDFYDFHQWMKSKWSMLNRIEFPGKHTLSRNTDRTFLEKRMVALNKYLCSILTITAESCYGESLQDYLLHFLEPGDYVIKKRNFSEKIDTLVNPLKQSVRSVTDVVKSVPDTFVNTVDGFTKIFHSKTPVGFIEANKVGASLDEADDNIPLRIILLLMDEVFDLKSRNQWLRRRIVAIIRQVLKAMLGDTINRRIVDYVAYLTSPVRVSGYLQNLQKSLWPGGNKISSRSSRDTETKMRTRFASKLSLLASLSDELKHLIGSETTRRGLLCVFDMCQNRVLNRRFILVLFEGIIRNLFPDKNFVSQIQRLHYRSNRVGRNRPFLIPSERSSPSSTLTRASSANPASSISSSISPRSSRKKR